MPATVPSFLFLFTFFLQDDMYGVFCPVSGNVSIFVHQIEFYLVFKYVYVYMGFLSKKVAKFYTFYWTYKMAAIFFSIFNSSPVSRNFCLFCLKSVFFYQMKNFT